MMDRRLTVANGRVADIALKGHVAAERFVPGTPASVTRPVVDLLDAPDGRRERQLLLGWRVHVFETRDGWAYVRSDRDGYVGYLRAEAIGDPAAPTHSIGTPATHAYRDEDMKSPDLMRLSFGAEVTVIDERRRFFETNVGFIPKKHLRPLDRPFTDPATVAQMFYGVPYLWGGNSSDGIDCSGLVQAACLACGIPCPGDSDLQEDSLGTPVEIGSPLQRGDLLFWKGHVALAVDDQTLIHANAHHMAVAYEPAEAAILRIKAQDDGPVTHHRRV
ncbi:NlpC/P60 family protein [Loktanella sp. IMCC34160]|uniref:C40 family peptidase n=1 Tax=Loktanella sp. IMCC34160 TaxID=2510646 RepID=UPI0013ED13E7|nr:NlpC/P60 family protein [Loktanella sp. IMCC34160]